MTYATLADLIARAGADEIGQVADRDMDGIPDPDVIAAALVHADNTVNGYAAARYQLPFAPVPDLVRTWAVAIARHHLHRHVPPENVVADYRDALAALRDLARGAIRLTDAAGAEASGDAGAVGFAGPEPRAGRTLRGYL